MKDLGLARFRNGETASADCELPEADLRRLVRLRVRPKRYRVGVGIGLETLEVRLQSVEIEDHDGRLHLVDRSPDLGLQQLECPICPCPRLGGVDARATRRSDLGHPRNLALMGDESIVDSPSGAFAATGAGEEARASSLGFRREAHGASGGSSPHLPPIPHVPLAWCWTQSMRSTRGWGGDDTGEQARPGSARPYGPRGYPRAVGVGAGFCRSPVSSHDQAVLAAGCSPETALAHSALGPGRAARALRKSIVRAMKSGAQHARNPSLVPPRAGGSRRRPCRGFARRRFAGCGVAEGGRYRVAARDCGIVVSEPLRAIGVTASS